MTTLRFVAPALLLFVSTVGFSAHAASVPCEEALKELRARKQP